MLFRKFRSIGKKTGKQEEGAVVIEATLSLTAFMFLIIIILSIVNICILQQKIGLALNMSAKEIAQYAYIYSMSGVNGIQADNYEGAKEAREDIETVVTGISDMHGSLMALTGGNASLGDTYQKISGTAEEIGDTISDAAQSGHMWVISFLRLVGNEAAEAGKGQICGSIAKGLVQKNLVNYDGVSADEFLRWHGITEGIDGIHFSDSVFMRNGSSDIILVADYEVRVLALLDHDITLHFRQAAFTRAWEATPLESGIVKSEEGGQPGDSGQLEEMQTPEESSALSPQEIRQKMIDEYGEAVVLEVEKYMDTSNFTEDDWRYQMTLYATADMDEIDGIPIVNGLVYGKIPLEEYIQARLDSVKQGAGRNGQKEDHLFVLGKYKESPSYIEVAEEHGANYFDMGSNWNEIQQKYGLTDKEMFDLFNAPVLDEAIQRGQVIVYAHNPEAPKEKENNTALYMEWQYLKEKYGYTEAKEDKDGVFWYAK